MARKRPRSIDGDVSESERDYDGQSVKRRKYAKEEDRIVWPLDKFDLAYVAWARQQFPTTGFCIDFRAKWLKSQHGCRDCEKFVVRRASDIDLLCKDDNMRKMVSEDFPSQLDVETLEHIEYLMCSKPHGASSFGYSKTDNGTVEVLAKFEEIQHLGWPEFSTLLERGGFSDLTVDLDERSVTLKFFPEQSQPFNAEEVAIALVGYYLRSQSASSGFREHDAV